MIRVLWFMLAVFLASAAGAKTVRVTSGEHEGFTRLVFAIDPATDWALEQVPQQATLVFKDTSLSFKDSTVFQRIPKTRLLSVAQAKNHDETRYTLSLACPCDVQAYAYQNAYIVVDILDSTGPLPPDPVFEFIKESQTIPPLPQIPEPQDEAYTFPEALRRPPPALEEPSTIVDSPIPEVLPVNVNHEVAGNAEDDLKTTVDEARTKLLERLTFAAEMGLVDFEEGRAPSVDTPETEPEAETAETPTPAEVAPETPVEDQFVITTVYERDSRQHSENPNLGLENCPSDARLDIASWSDGSDFSDQLSKLRSGLLKEFDTPNPEAATALVKLYIRYGFGVEALEYLKDYADDIPDAALLRDMARVMDGDSALPDGPLVNAAGCAGAAGLWSLVGMYPDISEGDVKENTVLSAFSELPPDVRRAIGPRLVQAFTELNLVGSARLATEIMERAPGEKSDFEQLATARLARDEGNTDAAEVIYRDLVSRNSGASITALIELAEMLLEEDKPAPLSLVADLGAAADEVRGTKDGYALRRLEGLWLQKTHGGLAALDLIAKERGIAGLDSGILDQVAGEIFREMSPEVDGTAAYVKAVSSYLYLLENVKNKKPLMLDIGEKLIEAGLPNMTIDLLEPYKSTEDRAVNLILAKALLADFNPAEALAVLENIEGQESVETRIQAFLNLGDFQHAFAELGKLEDGNHFQPDLAWYPGDWALAVKQDPYAARILQKISLHTAVPSVSPQPEGVGGDSKPSLAETTALLQRSSAVSDELASLLESGDAPVE